MADKLVDVGAGHISSLEKRTRKRKKPRAPNVETLNELAKSTEPSAKKVSV